MSIKDKLPAGSPLGFGTAPLGNMFRAIPDAEAAATVRAAWEQGTRFFEAAICPTLREGTRAQRALGRSAPNAHLLARVFPRLRLDLSAVI